MSAGSMIGSHRRRPTARRSLVVASAFATSTVGFAGHGWNGPSPDGEGCSMRQQATVLKSPECGMVASPVLGPH